MSRLSFRSAAYFHLRIILIWIAACLFFTFLRNFGKDPTPHPIFKDVLPAHGLAINLLFGFLAGLVYTSIEELFERPYFQRHSYIRILIAKLVLFFFGMKFTMAFTLLFGASITDSVTGNGEIIQMLRSKNYWVIFTYFIVVASIISFVRMVSKKFGPGMLWNMFLGRYRNPREEQRVFMFLDLRSSTTIAEKLGHLRFSSLIQDCFADLTPVINKHRVEIYQYVGDEAVLSWPIESGFEENHCIHAYFDFMEVLRSRSVHYEKTYGLQPFFKAGVHLGNVIVAEVGLVKREIAYHGDVLNTTARIQSRCNELQEPLLISNELLQSLEPDHRIQSKDFGEELLKGKQSKVSIHGIRLSQQEIADSLSK